MFTIVYWDTCAYRAIISRKYERPSHAKTIENFATYIAKLEKSKGYQSLPCAIVLWELLSHLPAYNSLQIDAVDKDKWESDFKSCFSAFKFIKHQMIENNEALSIILPQAELAEGIDYEFKGAAKKDILLMYKNIAENIRNFAENFDSITFDKKTWRSNSSLVDMASEMHHLKKEWTDYILCSLSNIDKKDNDSEKSFINEIKEAYTSILYHCVNEKYIPRGKFLRNMHSVAFSFIERWARNIYDNFYDVEDLAEWASSKKLSNNIIDALLLAYPTNIQETTKWIFVTLDKSIIDQNCALDKSNHKILGLDEYLQDIGFLT